MFAKAAARLAVFVLKRSDLSLKDRNLLMTCVFDKLGALPLIDMISVDDTGTISLSGKPVDYALASKLKQSARLALESTAFRVVCEQVKYTAITVGVHKGENPDQLMFGRASLWVTQQVENWLKVLAQSDDKPNPLE